MIKGVNKKVLEINNPQSIFFEKAVLYLKPNMSSVSYKLLRAEAQEMIRSMSPKQPKLVLWRRLVKAAVILAAALVGALATCLIFYKIL